MKSPNLIYFISIFLCGMTLISCDNNSTNEPDEPKPDNPKDNPSEYVSDWSVVYYERSNQDPSWETLINTSEACISWKKTNESYNTGNFSEGSVDVWTWYRKYDSTKESDVIADIETFIKFTLVPKPDSKKLSGYDSFTAVLTCDDRDYSVEYGYNPHDASRPIDKWIIKFNELKTSGIADPKGYEEWVNAHKGFVTFENEHRREWTMEVTSMSSEFIEDNIIPFIHFTQSPTSASDMVFSFYTVSVEQTGTGISQNYSYTAPMI